MPPSHPPHAWVAAEMVHAGGFDSVLFFLCSEGFGAGWSRRSRLPQSLSLILDVLCHVLRSGEPRPAILPEAPGGGLELEETP